MRVNERTSHQIIILLQPTFKSVENYNFPCNPFGMLNFQSEYIHAIFLVLTSDLVILNSISIQFVLD